jgi:cytochrome c1
MKLAPAIATLAILSLCACAPTARKSPAQLGGVPERGAVLIVQEACGACHQIPGIQEAHGLVGPSLAGFARHTMIAGLLPNTPRNLALWVRTPQAYVPGNAMPNANLSPQQAADVAAYLETLD